MDIEQRVGDDIMKFRTKYIKLIESAFQKSWSKETCYPKLQKKWSPQNPALGQCAISALIIQDYFGGDLLYCKHLKHFWNKLPNGQEIDLTKSQFPDNTKICVDKVITGEPTPEYKHNSKSLTLERYAKLKRMVEEHINLNIKQNHWIYLLSSNYTKEYILDILETMFLPAGSIQYFRYQLRWLDDDLRKLLPKEGEKINRIFKNKEIIICYLYQVFKEKKSEETEWIYVYPIRKGILLDAYKSGDDDSDIAYFYFKLDDFILYAGQDYRFIMKEVIGDYYNKKYAFFSFSLNQSFFTKKEYSKSAFYKICEAFNIKHFTSPDKKRKYFPLFCYMDGIKDSKGNIIKPKYHPLIHKNYYKIKECQYYLFEFNTYLARKQKAISIEANLMCNPKIFSSPVDYKKIDISSRYDKGSWIIASSFIDKNIWTTIKFETKPSNHSNKKNRNFEFLNVSTNFLLNIKRRFWYRFIDILSEIFLVIGSGSIAVKVAAGPEKMTWWYWITISGYLGWVIVKLCIKLWRG